MGEQFLVKGAGDFRQENRVIVVLKELRFGARTRYAWNAPPRGPECKHPRTHPPCSSSRCKGELVAAGGKCAAAFPFRFVTIAPATAQTIGERARVFLAERSQGSYDFVDRIIETDMRFNFGELTGHKYRKHEADRDRERAVSTRSNGAAAEIPSRTALINPS